MHRYRAWLAAFGFAVVAMAVLTAAAYSNDRSVLLTATPARPPSSATASPTSAPTTAPIADTESPSATPGAPPTFVCEGEQCSSPRAPKTDDSKYYPTPPQWLTSPNAAGCIANFVPGSEIVTDFAQVAQEAPQLAQTQGLYDPNYWLVQLNSSRDAMTFPECRAWSDELRAGK